MRRLGARLLAAAATIGLLGVAMPPAHAIPLPTTTLGNVTVSYNPGPPSSYSITPSSKDGTAGDTFLLINTMSDNAASYISIVNGTGAATMAGTNCVDTSACKINDNPGSPGTFAVVTVSTPGTFTIHRALFGGSITAIGTFTVNGPASVGPYTITFDHSCQLSSEFGRSMTVALGATYKLPTSCTALIFKGMLGWRQQGGLIFPAGTEVVAADNTQWTAIVPSPTVTYVYDANVAGGDACLTAAGVNLPLADRTSSVSENRLLVGATVFSPPDPVCTPPRHAFKGWSTRGNGTGDSCGVRVLQSDFRTLCSHQFRLDEESFTYYAMWMAA